VRAQRKEAGLECLAVGLHAVSPAEGGSHEEAVDRYVFEEYGEVRDELWERLEACGFDVQPETSAKQMLDMMVELEPSFRAITDRFVEVVPST
jgi:hypothetical protein